MKSAAREAAINSGQKHYTSETACKHCGSFVKYVSNSSCRNCIRRRSIHKLYDNELMAPYRTNDKILKRTRNWRNKNPEKYKNQWLKRYGITIDDYNQMLIEQNGVCAICGNLDCVSGRNLAVDHCHDTGKVRGLLCFKCNTSIGNLNTEFLLLQALSYIRRHSCE